MAEKGRRDAFGSILGVLTFLGGVGLLAIVFRLAYTMFETPPREMLGLRDGQAIDLNAVGPNVIGVVIRILVLILMGLIGSLIANRGISLYTSSRALARKEVVVSEPTE